MISGIYVIENTANQKRYIGQSVNCSKRIKIHLWELNNNRHDNIHLQQAFNKYASAKFNFVILEECSPEKLDDLECYYIKLYNTTDRKFGYNSDSGGHKNKHLSAAHKKKLSDKRKLYKASDSTKEKIRIAMTGRIMSHEWRNKLSISKTGKKLTTEHKQKLSLAKLGKPGASRGKSRPKMSLETRRKMSEAHIGHKDRKDKKGII